MRNKEIGMSEARESVEWPGIWCYCWNRWTESVMGMSLLSTFLTYQSVLMFWHVWSLSPSMETVAILCHACAITTRANSFARGRKRHDNFWKSCSHFIVLLCHYLAPWWHTKWMPFKESANECACLLWRALTQSMYIPNVLIDREPCWEICVYI